MGLLKWGWIQSKEPSKGSVLNFRSINFQWNAVFSPFSFPPSLASFSYLSSPPQNSRYGKKQNFNVASFFHTKPQISITKLPGTILGISRWTVLRFISKSNWMKAQPSLNFPQTCRPCRMTRPMTATTPTPTRSPAPWGPWAGGPQGPRTRLPAWSPEARRTLGSLSSAVCPDWKAPSGNQTGGTRTPARRHPRRSALRAGEQTRNSHEVRMTSPRPRRPLVLQVRKPRTHFQRRCFLQRKAKPRGRETRGCRARLRVWCQRAHWPPKPSPVAPWTCSPTAQPWLLLPVPKETSSPDISLSQRLRKVSPTEK